MANSGYSADKMEAFLNAKTQYITAKNEYMNSLKSYRTILNQTTKLHKNATNSNLSDFQAKDHGKFKTKEGVIIQGSNSSSTNSNILNNDNHYVSDLVNQGNLKDGTSAKSNTVVQMGLDALQYDDSTNMKKVYQFSNYNQPIKTHNNACTIDNVYQCDSYAKMMNHEAYGLSEQGGQTCDCYTFTDVSNIGTWFNDVTETVNIDKINDKSTTNISYLGILFDQGLYTLSEKNYSDNFKNLYENKLDKINLISGALRNTNCNPFSGSGINNLNIKNLGILRCDNI